MKDHDPAKDPSRETRTEPPHEEGDPSKPAAAPIEREHETAAGVFEEDEKREEDPPDEHERERS